MTKKQQMIEWLMEGTNFAFPNQVKENLKKKSLNVIMFYIHTMPNCKKEHIIQDIIRLG